MLVYHFVKSHWGLDNLRRRRLKIALINELNNPFELRAVASPDPEVRAAYNKLRLGLSSYMGLLCFSGHWRNPVQWSHYADHHRGICLGFEIADKALHRVKYGDERLTAKPDAMRKFGRRSKAHVEELLTLKFSHWSNEDEYRLFANLEERDDDGRYYHNFGDTLDLRRVIVGAECKVTRAELSEVVGASHKVECFKARLSFQRFRVVRQKCADLWQ